MGTTSLNVKHLEESSALPTTPKAQTHLALDRTLCGALTQLSCGRAEVLLNTTEAMTADKHGLVHGGFVFGAVDHAAMLAVNHPNVVLAGAEMRFLAPVRVGDQLRAWAEVTNTDGHKHTVRAEAFVGERRVFEGTLVAYVLREHVLSSS